MVTASQIIALLQQRQIYYKLINHPAVYTAAEADRYVTNEQFIRTKNLFIKDKHHFFLLLLQEDKRLNSRKFRQVAHTSRISFASPAELLTELQLTPGTVSPFGLLNNHDHNVSLYVDRDVIQAPLIGCHPNDNTKTVILPTKDLFNILTTTGFATHIITKEALG